MVTAAAAVAIIGTDSTPHCGSLSQASYGLPCGLRIFAALILATDFLTDVQTFGDPTFDAGGAIEFKTVKPFARL